MKSVVSFLLCILVCNFSYSQSLSGYWEGSSEHSVLILNPIKIILEIEVNNDSLITGVIHSYYKKERFDHIKISGFINWKDSTVFIVDEEEISHNINVKIYETCLGKMKLSLTKTANTYFLDGKWKDKSNKLFRCPTLHIAFEKIHSDKALLTLPALPKMRITDIQKVIELDPDEIDSIKCSLFDNGEIDNDTASVYLNDSLIIIKQRLSAYPIEFFLTLDKTKQIHKLKLFADNLGTIPPNTALLIITTREKRYTITLSSTYTQNGSVELFLKE